MTITTGTVSILDKDSATVIVKTLDDSADSSKTAYHGLLNGSDGAPISNTAPLPTKLSPFLVAASAFTRPANTTVYAVGDAVSNSATAGSVVPVTITVARAVDASGIILRGLLRKTGTTTAYANFRVHLYDVLPVVSGGDNAAFSNTTAGWVGSMDCSMTVTGTDGAVGVLTPTYGSSINFAPVSGTANLYALVEALATYTPASAEQFTLELEAY